MEVTELMNLIVNNGFAVAVSAYLLIRLEKQINTLSGSINKLNTIISRKLGVVIDNDVSGDNSHKVDQKKAINIFFKMFIAFNFVYILGSFRLNYWYMHTKTKQLNLNLNHLLIYKLRVYATSNCN